MFVQMKITWGQNMKHKIKLTIAIAAVLAACATVDVGRTIIDVAAKWAGPKPTPSTDINFKNSDEFDMRLRGSLKNEYDAVDVAFNNQGSISPTALPSRIDRWLTRIDITGGKVVVCPINTNFNYLEFGSEIILRLTKGIDHYKTYQPANLYNAAVYVDANDPNKALGVIFEHRVKGDEFGESCKSLSSF